MVAAQTDVHREPVAGRDGAWLQDAPHNLMVINSVFAVDRMQRETLRDLFAERVVEAGERYARFSRKVVFHHGRPYWEDDPDFDIDRHIVLAPPAELDPGALATREALQEFVGGEASKPLPADRPRWQMLFVPEYREGLSAFVIRIHHVMADGMSLVPVLFSMMDPCEGEAETLPQVARKSTAWDAAAAVLAGPFLLSQKFLWRADHSVVHGPTLSGRKRVSWTEPIPIDVVKAVKNACGATVNDVLMACVSSAFERYVRTKSGAPLTRLRVSMPVNVRAPGEEPRMENKFAAVMLDLPVGVADVRERVLATKKRLDSLKRSPEPLFTYGTVRLMLKALPAGVSRGLINYLASKVTCVISNVPGPQRPLYLKGHRLRGMMFWVPQRAEIGVGVSMLSFAGELMIGVICDTAVVEEPRELVECFSEELRRLADSVA
jgi:hypothetical protein